MKVVAYLRVSTDRQAEEGLGLDIQRDAIRAWATQHRHEVVLWCADEGVSGSNGLDARNALPDALQALQSGAAAGLVVYRLDRLARDLVVQESLLAEVKRFGAEVFSTSPAESAYIGDDESDPTRKLIRQILGAVSEYERSMIRLRLRSGRRRKAEKGGFAYGSPPLGYRAEAGALVSVESEQAALARVLELHAVGRSTREIAAALTDDGFMPKRGGAWHAATVWRIINQHRREPTAANEAP